MSTTVMGVFTTKKTADQAVAALVAAGIPRDQISLILKDTPHHQELIRKDTDDTARGVVTGVVAGGAAAALLVGALAIPAFGLIAAGPWLAAVAASGGAGAVTGGLVGGLVGHNLGEQTMEEYESALKNDALVLGVHTVHSRSVQVMKILEQCGGTMIADSVHPGEAEHGAGS